MPKREIRFQELVKHSGKPQVVSLWTDPKLDRSFMKAVKENRVLTLLQEPASKKRDFGQIGFRREPHAAYLVFPQSLPADTRLRIVGIKYDLIEQPRVSDPVKVSAARVPRPATKPRTTGKLLEVLVRREAATETVIRVKARTDAAARKQAVAAANREPFDLTTAVFRNVVRSVTPVREDDPSRNGTHKSAA